MATLIGLCGHPFFIRPVRFREPFQYIKIYIWYTCLQSKLHIIHFLLHTNKQIICIIIIHILVVNSRAREMSPWRTPMRAAVTCVSVFRLAITSCRWPSSTALSPSSFSIFPRSFPMSASIFAGICCSSSNCQRRQEREETGSDLNTESQCRKKLTFNYNRIWMNIYLFFLFFIVACIIDIFFMKNEKKI